MDQIIKAISNKHNLKMTIIDATDSLNEIIELQETNPLASIALGRTVIATALIGCDMKEEKAKMTSVIHGNGPIGAIIGEYKNHSVRGFCNNPTFAENNFIESKDIIAQVVGREGTLEVIKDLGMKEPFSGSVRLVSGEINLDFAYYLMHSEQIKSVIACSIQLDSHNKIAKAVGFFAQLLPNHSEADLDYLEEKTESITSISQKINECSNLQEFFNMFDDNAKIILTESLSFKCDCTKERALSTLRILPEDELKEIEKTGEAVEISCDFCSKSYDFPFEELRHIFLKS